MLKKNIDNINIYLFFLLNFSIFIASPLMINFTLILIGILVLFFFKFELLKKIEILIFSVFVIIILLSTYLSELTLDTKLASLGWIKFLLLLFFFFSLNIDKKLFLKISKFFLYLIYILIFDVFIQRFLNLEFF